MVSGHMVSMIDMYRAADVLRSEDSVMTADSLTSAGGNIGLLLGFLLVGIGPAAVFGALSLMSGFGRRGKHLRRFIVVMSVAAGVSVAGAGLWLVLDSADQTNSVFYENADAVQSWAESEYGIRVSDDEVEGMIGPIKEWPTSQDEVFAADGPDGPLEVKLTRTEDGQFGLLQRSADFVPAEALR